MRRIARIDGADTVGSYVHGGRIGVLVELAGGDAELARDIAMHVAAMNPAYADVDSVPADVLASLRRRAVEEAG